MINARGKVLEIESMMKSKVNYQAVFSKQIILPYER